MSSMRRLGALALLSLLVACSPRPEGVGASRDGGVGNGGSEGGLVDAGRSTLAFSVVNWNIEWFGDPAYGPVDDGLQLDNVRTVISNTGADFWGLAEIVDAADFEELKRQLPGYDGFVASDPARVSNGGWYYSPNEQKLAVLFRSEAVSVHSAQVILTGSNYDFGGRPPLRVDLRLSRGGASVDLVAILLHMKAFSSLSDYERRQRASVALQGYLDSFLPDARVLVLGDWNDDVDQSISRVNGSYLDTPFRNFLNAPQAWSFVTQPLSLARQRSTAGGSEFIDHQLASDEVMSSYVRSSAVVLKPAIPSYSSTTSDHYPVYSRYELTP